MNTKRSEALRIAEWLEGIRGNTWPSYIPQEAAAELRRQHAEIETLRAGYDAARLEIVSLRERVQQLGQLARDANSRGAAQTAPVDAAVQRDAAIGMLADRGHAVNTNGTGWDGWDGHFKDKHRDGLAPAGENWVGRWG